jgi:hypothetical protein
MALTNRQQCAAIGLITDQDILNAAKAIQSHTPAPGGKTYTAEQQAFILAAAKEITGAQSLASGSPSDAPTKVVPQDVDNVP